MKIIQTFWTAGQDSLKYGFGWTHPEYNLMSWALSCLSLREHYDEVELYTDSAGYHILIEVLQLPYTKTHVIFDNFQCLPHHWALSKIKTYSLQTEPFLHIDGDIYLPCPLPERVLNAPLVAQNREIGTIYYRHMMDHVLKMENLELPDYVMKGLKEDSIASYNMGVFGGTDITFIHEYCNEVLQFINKNRINDFRCRNSRVDCNVFFEQVLFAVLADHRKREITDVLGRAMQDEGYTVHEFCNLDNYEEGYFFHLLGGHKKNVHVVPMLESAIIRMYPELYKQIVGMFPDRYVRFGKTSSSPVLSSVMSMEKSIAQWEDFLDKRAEEWKDLPVEELFETEKSIVRCSKLSRNTIEEQKNIVLRCNPNFALFEIPSNWHPKAVEALKEKFQCEKRYPLTMIGVIPTVRAEGLRSKPILNMELRIIKALQKGGLSFDALRESILNEYNISTEQEKRGAYTHILHSTTLLLNSGIIMENHGHCPLFK